MPPAVEPAGALAQVAIEASQTAETPASLMVADAGTQALAAYQDALMAYDAVRQHDMSRFPGLKFGFLSNLGYQIELAYRRCLACGIDPARHASARIQEESRL
jgi:hypothetical protein